MYNKGPLPFMNFQKCLVRLYYMFIIIFLQISVYCETFFKNDYFTNFIVWAQINSDGVTCGNTYKKGGQRKKDATIIDNIIDPFDVSCF